MGVLEDVVVNAKSAAETVGREAGRLVDLSKLRFTASDIQREMAKEYETLGKMVYDSYKAGTSVDAGFSDHFKVIDELNDKLTEVNAMINTLSKKTVCTSCGFKNDDKAVYCSRCGKKLAGNAQKSENKGASSDTQSAADEEDTDMPVNVTNEEE
jgi:hypothetical protein